MYSKDLMIRPYEHGAEIDKSRKITGIDKWARSSPAIGTIMLVLGWFTIPVEVILRRDFGQRYFTNITFYAGLVLILTICGLHFGYSHLLAKYFDFFRSNPDAEKEADTADWAIIICFALYFYMGLYHLFKIKWRNQVNTPLHSFDDGKSRLNWLSGVVVWLINIFALPWMVLAYWLIPRKQRKGKPYAKFITDREAFTTTTLEPIVILIAAIYLTGVPSLWLFVSAFALLIYGYWKEMARKNKILDFQDGKIEAGLMRELRASKGLDISQPKRQTGKSVYPQAQPLPQINVQYPDLNTIIDQMNRDKSHLGKAARI